MVKLKGRCIADKRNSFKILIRKSEQKRLLGRSRHRREGVGKSGFKESVEGHGPD
jgi:hypothetical protein